MCRLIKQNNWLNCVGQRDVETERRQQNDFFQTAYADDEDTFKIIPCNELLISIYSLQENNETLTF